MDGVERTRNLSTGGIMMLQLCKNQKEKILNAIQRGSIDAADVSFPNLIDTILLKMKELGISSGLEGAFKDKRKKNAHFPFSILLLLFIAAKMKLKTSLTDVPYAITDGELLVELGWNIWDTDRDLKKGLMAEGTIRNLVSKYTAEESETAYNQYVEEFIKPHLQLFPTVHLLDCSMLAVELGNPNYEGSEVVKQNGEVIRGYKLATLRGLLDDAGILEEIKFGAINIHDVDVCREMILNSKALKEGDIVIQDRGFISREILNQLKNIRKVDIYMPAKKSMILYKEAVQIAKKEGKWQAHPNKKRKTQKIQLVRDMGDFWTSNKPEEDVPLHACVVWDTKKDQYFVFMTTDTSQTAKRILTTYELRPEIEEDYRQLKDFWKLEDFKSTKFNFIVFHVVMVLIGYLYFQLFKNTEAGSSFSGKTLPVVMKNFRVEKPKQVIIYAGQYFALFSFLDFMKLYASCSKEIRDLLDPVLALV